MLVFELINLDAAPPDAERLTRTLSALSLIHI